MQRRMVTQHVSYEVNGVRYKSIDEVPAEFRKFFEDKDGNGVPDIVERVSSKMGTTLRFESRSVGSSAADLGMADALARLSDQPNSIGGSLACSQCGYDLRQTPVGGTCPECGVAVERSIGRLIQPRRSIGRLVLEIVADHPMMVGNMVVGIVIAVIVIVLLIRALI